MDLVRGQCGLRVTGKAPVLPEYDYLCLELACDLGRGENEDREDREHTDYDGDEKRFLTRAGRPRRHFSERAGIGECGPGSRYRVGMLRSCDGCSHASRIEREALYLMMGCGLQSGVVACVHAVLTRLRPFDRVMIRLHRGRQFMGMYIPIGWL
jgi:hypothetical protein